MADKFGDSEFKDFMNREYNREDPLIVIIEAIRAKMLAVSDIYGKSLDAYVQLEKDDQLKTVLKGNIEKMMDFALETLNQFNCALINDEEDDLDDLEGLNEQ